MAEEYNLSSDVKCSHEACDRTLKNNAWKKIKASDWFFQKNGDSWCPDHHPEWVASWRANKQSAAESPEWIIETDSRGNVLRARTRNG